MNITFRQLQVFESVARNLSYTHAAQELYLSQPAVSMQIKQLESALGINLFEQLGKKVSLTEAGNVIYRYSRIISGLLSEIRELVEEFKGIQRGHLKISVATTANYFATRFLAEFVKEYSGTTFSLDVTNREVLVHKLEQNEVDLVIMGQPPEDMDLETQSFMENPLVVVAPCDHPFAHRKSIPIVELKNEMFVVRERGSGTRIAMSRYFEEHGIQLQTGMEMTSNEAIKQAVEAGLGLGIVSIHTLTLELETKRLMVLPVEGFPILRHWYLVHRKGKRLSPIADAFHKYVLSHGRAFMQK